MKKILFIIWSHSLGGGAEALLTTIVNRLHPQKYQIGILEFYHASTKKESVKAHIRIHDAITFEGDMEYQKKMYYTYHEPDQMIRLYVPAGYDLYISFNYQIPSFLLPKGGRNIAWIHGAVYDLAEDGMETYRHLQDKAFARAGKIVAISDVTACSIRDLFPQHADKLVEIYNAVDVERIREKADCTTEIRLKHPAMIFVGRLDDNKDPLRALDIFDKIARKNGLAHLYYLGKGELESQIREKVNACGLEGRVHVLGYQENPFPVMKQADVCCMTSKSEGFPLSLLESVALGVPFVSTDVGGARVLSNNGRCGCVYTSNEEGAQAALEILGTARELLEQECRESISRFTLDTYISRIEKLLDEVLEEEPAAEQITAWDGLGRQERLADRKYYYRFPQGLIPQQSRVIVYGAGDVGTNYWHYIQETGSCQIAAWVDAAAGKYRNTGKDVKDIETLFQVEYDFVLIAVMAEKVSKAIRADLCRRGIPDSKILWAKPIF